ncbi:MAG: glutathione S-transferase family protein, partial [Pseudomonadota bacterium]
ENVAILTWLNQTYPEARLLPAAATPFDHAKQTADLAAISGTIHPIVTRIALPARFVGDDIDPAAVRNAAINALRPLMEMLNDRLANGTWWYSDDWSIVDAYIFWAWWRLSVVDYPGGQFANMIDHAERIQDRPAVARAMATELEYARQMRADGLFVPHKNLDETT